MGSMYEAEFIWTEPASSVIVTGSFDNWSRSVHMAKGGSGFSTKVKIPYGQKTDYKFIVDGRWLVNSSFPTEWDQSGNVNNYIVAPSEPPSEPVRHPDPEPVTLVNQPSNITASVTPLAVPESSIIPHPGLTVDSSLARSIVESFLEAVSPAPKEIDTPIAEQDGIADPASSSKNLADTTTPSSAYLAVQDVVTPLATAAREKMAPAVTTVQGSISPLLEHPHTSEPAPLSPTVTEAPAALAADAKAPVVSTAPEPAKVSVGPQTSTEKKITSGNLPEGKPVAEGAAAITAAPAVMSTPPATVDLSASPVTSPATIPKSPATPPPQAPLQASATPVAAASVPIPETPVPAGGAVKTVSTATPTPAILPNEPSSNFSATTTSTTSSPAKPTSHKRRTSFGSKMFSRRSSGSGSETEGGSGRNLKRDGSQRRKRTSLIAKIKSVFKHDHHNPNVTDVSKEQS